MKKISTYTVTLHTYNVPYTRTANVYESDDPVFKGACFEVSMHSGAVGAAWEFKPFKTIQEAQACALQWLAPLHISCKPVKEN